MGKQSDLFSNPNVINENKIIEIKTPAQLTAEALYRKKLKEMGKINPKNKARGGKIKK